MLRIKNTTSEPWHASALFAPTNIRLTILAHKGICDWQIGKPHQQRRKPCACYDHKLDSLFAQASYLSESGS